MVMAMSSRTTASWFAWFHPAAHMLDWLLMFPEKRSHTPNLTPSTSCCCLCSRALCSCKTSFTATAPYDEYVTGYLELVKVSWPTW